MLVSAFADAAVAGAGALLKKGGNTVAKTLLGKKELRYIKHTKKLGDLPNLLTAIWSQE